MNVESFQRILIERGHEDNRLNVLGTNALEHIKTVELRHLDVEKDQIRRHRVDRFDCLTTITTFVENLNLRILLEEQTNVATREWFVVDNQRSDPVAVYCS